MSYQTPEDIKSFEEQLNKKNDKEDDKKYSDTSVKLNSQKIISDKRGKILHMLRNDDKHFSKFGEIYFSYVFGKQVFESNNCFFSSKDSIAQNKVDTLYYKQKYLYSSAKIINNNYHSLYNFITINSGKNKGIFKEMAVVNSKGIIGIVDNVSNNYATVQSILNGNSKIKS